MTIILSLLGVVFSFVGHGIGQSKAAVFKIFGGILYFIGLFLVTHGVIELIRFLIEWL